MVRAGSQLIGILLFSTLIAPSVVGHDRTGGGGTRDVTVVASGLDHPKGLAFAADGSLYVAESGHSNGTCPPPSQTQTVTSRGHNGAVARIAPDGTLTRVATGLSSVCDVGDYLGPAGVLPFATGVYILQAACTGALLTTPDASCAVSQPLLRLSAGGTTRPVAQFVSGGNGDTPNVPDEDPYAIAQGADRAVYVSDGADNAIWRLRPTATGVQRISRPLVQFPHDPTLTGLTLDKSGTIYVALFGKAPWQTRAGAIARVTPDGRYTIVRSGLFAPIGVAISPAGALYVLQYSSAFVLKPFPHFLPNTGVVFRLTRQGSLVPVVTGLNAPTALTFGPNGNLFITNNGTGVASTATGQGVSAHVGS